MHHATSGGGQILITGSNAFLLSSDLATLFTGRTFEIEVYPFSSKEYIDYFEYTNIDNAFDKYVMVGGMAGSYLYNSIENKYDYLNDIYNTLIIRDIYERNKLKDEKLWDNLPEQNKFLCRRTMHEGCWNSSKYRPNCSRASMYRYYI